MAVQDFTASPTIICVTGNMASGKSTLAEVLGSRIPNSCYVPEPHDQNPFLALYLRDQQRWGFTAQLRYFYDYVRTFEGARNHAAPRYFFVDTGLWTNRLVYAKYLCDEHLMTADEYDFYQALSNRIQQGSAIAEPRAYIFVHALPQTCWQRMHRRGWSYQTNAVELTYIETLQHYFEAMRETVAAAGTPILDISSDDLDYTVEAGQREALGRVERFLQGG